MKKQKKIVLILLAIFIILIVPKGRFKNGKKVVYIDPGHGGKDPGTISKYEDYEKDINLEISKKLYKRLKKMGYSVYMTRSEDIYVENEERANMANEKSSDIYLSIHMNALEDNTSVMGTQVLYYPDEDSINEEIANMLMENIISKTSSANKGIVAREKLVVLKYTQMPSFIIEAGFMTNDGELEKLKSPDYQDELVSGLVAFIEDFYK